MLYYDFLFYSNKIKIIKDKSLLQLIHYLSFQYFQFANLFLITTLILFDSMQQKIAYTTMLVRWSLHTRYMQHIQ